MADNMYQVLASGSDNNNEGRFSRFLVEISFTIILVWLVFQIVPGLIVDTFSTLRKNLEEFMDDMNNVCFICGMEREEIEKIYVGKSGFGDHLLDHNLKNYFCFLFYLKEKNPIELTGVESYVKDLVDNQIGSWIPSEDCLKREIMKMNN